MHQSVCVYYETSVTQDVSGTCAKSSSCASTAATLAAVAAAVAASSSILYV
jgi:hypothetical protein